jgi:hypothetical protein
MKTVDVRHYLRGAVDSCVNAAKETAMLLLDRLTSAKTSLR